MNRISFTFSCLFFAQQQILCEGNQKLCFRTEDPTTINYLSHITGRALTKQTSYSSGDSSTMVGLGSKTYSSSSSTTEVERSVIDGQLMRRLHTDSAIALLSVDGSGMDDRIRLSPLYV